MKYQWKKLGLLYCPSEINRHPKLLTHAANPLAIFIEDDIYRIFFSGRDINNRSSVGAVDIDIIQCKIVNEYNYPFFEHGPNDSYYADGVSIGNYYDISGTRYILFMAWQTQNRTHWRGDIGRLILTSDLTLELDGSSPFIRSDTIDPISLSYPYVIKTLTGKYQMWYGSTVTWDAGNGEMLHTINYATSEDGHSWHRKGISVPYEIGIAQAFSRPTVIQQDETHYEMWFSYRGALGKSYRIGYAISQDGEKWENLLHSPGIDVSSHGWDSEMIEYPFVFHHKGQRYMLYNGNNHGKTGFGLAIWMDK